MMATVLKEFSIPQLSLQRMSELDIPDVVAAERAGYAFPWSEGIFRDCLRAGYLCRVARLDECFVGYGILSVGAGEAHVLNLCIRPEYRCRGLGRRLLQHLMDLARVAGAHDLFSRCVPAIFPRSGCTRRWACGRSAFAAVTTRPRMAAKTRSS